MTNLILVINGHPNRTSFTAGLAEAYAEGVRSRQGNVRILHLGDLNFDLSLHEGYGKIMPLEPDLYDAQALITQCKHIVFFYPQWWGSSPAVLKGFIDRVFLPGFAFKYHAKGAMWDKLLKGRSGEIWLLSDSPWFWYYFKYWNSAVKWLKTATLEFSGVKPVKIHVVDRVRFSTPEQRTAFLNSARIAGTVAAVRCR